MRRFLCGEKMRPRRLSGSRECARCLIPVDGRRVSMRKCLNLCGLPVSIVPRTRVRVFCCYCCWCCSDECESLRCDSAAFLWAASRSPNPVFIRIHKAMELLLLLCAAAKSAREALMRAQPAQECRLKVSRHKRCSGWGGATSKKSATPQSAGPVFSLYLPSFFFSFLFFSDFPFQTSVLLNIFL